MSPLRHALVDYLAVRRALGYKLERAEKLLAQFLTYLEDRGEHARARHRRRPWPGRRCPRALIASWASHRLSVVRRFAAHLHAIDPATEVPARGPAAVATDAGRRPTSTPTRTLPP